MSPIKTQLINRLKMKGLEVNVIPGFIRSLANSFFVNKNVNLFTVNRKMHYLGWDELEMDYYTFQLAIECFESEGLKNLENLPPAWFIDTFTPTTDNL